MALVRTRRPLPWGAMATDPWQRDAFESSLLAVSDNTRSAYRRDVAAFVEWTDRLGLDGPAAVDRKVLRRYVSHLSTRGYARRTIARKAAALRRYFGWAQRVTLARRRRSVHGPLCPGGRRPSASRAPCRRAHRAARRAAGDGGRRSAGRPAARDDAVLELLYGSGLRVGELCGLRPDDLDLDEGLVRVWGKGAKQRRVPLSAPAVQAVAAWLADGRAALRGPPAQTTRSS